MIDDTSLLAAARKGHQQALGQIFDHYAPRLFSYVARSCHDPSEADRIVGDVFVQLLEHLSEGQGPSTNLRSYLFQIAYHALVDHIRDASHFSPLEYALDMPDGLQPVASQVEERDLLRKLVHAIRHQLTGEQQQVILLRFVEGFSLNETARITSRTVNAVSVLQNRAVARLRQVLETPILNSPGVAISAREEEFRPASMQMSLG